MSIHENYTAMLKESLPQFIQHARMGIEAGEGRGALGYPSATELFVVVDTIGSHLRRRRALDPYTVIVDGEPQPIRKTSHHFRALNSPYFGFSFSEAQIKKLYDLIRCPLSHNALLGPFVRLTVGESIPEGIAFRGGVIHISLPDFLRVCERAVDHFLNEVDAIVRDSAAVEVLQMAAEATPPAPGDAPVDWPQSMYASGVNTRPPS